MAFRLMGLNALPSSAKRDCSAQCSALWEPLGTVWDVDVTAVCGAACRVGYWGEDGK